LGSIVPFLDENTNTLKIIEEGILPNKKTILKNQFNEDTTPFSLELFGYNNIKTKTPLAGFVKGFGIKTEITNNLATIISIGAQAKGLNAKYDGTSFSNWNRGLTDRLVSIKDIEPSLIQEESQSLEEKYNDQILGYKELLKSTEDRSFVGEEGSVSFKTALQGVLKYNQELVLEEQEKPVTSPAFLPLNLNLTLDGFSGIKIYQVFNTNSKFLPYPFPESLEFLIKGVSHKISNNIWTTTIDSLSVPLTEELRIDPKKKPIKKNTTLPPPQTSNPEEDPAIIYFSGEKINKNYISELLPLLQYNNGSVALENQLTNFKTAYPNVAWVIKSEVTPKLYPEAAEQLAALYQAYIAQFGKGFIISDAFRTLAKQEYYYQQSGGYKNKNGQWTGGKGWAAKPGYSNHGWGGAIDISELWQKVQGDTNPETNRQGRIQSPEYKWLAQNGPNYGWYNPWRLCDYAGTDEMWHWEYLAKPKNS